MTGGTLPPGPVSEKVSVRHCVAVEAAVPLVVMVGKPFSMLSDDAVMVLESISRIKISRRLLYKILTVLELLKSIIWSFL
jgi:hypothetical protein